VAGLNLEPPVLLSFMPKGEGIFVQRERKRSHSFPSSEKPGGSPKRTPENASFFVQERRKKKAHLPFVYRNKVVEAFDVVVFPPTLVGGGRKGVLCIRRNALADIGKRCVLLPLCCGVSEEAEEK